MLHKTDVSERLYLCI